MSDIENKNIFKTKTNEQNYCVSVKINMMEP